MRHFTFDISTALGLGRDAAALTFTQISLRGIIVFIATLVIVRCGDRRFLSQKTAFDAVLNPADNWRRERDRRCLEP